MTSKDIEQFDLSDLDSPDREVRLACMDRFDAWMANKVAENEARTKALFEADPELAAIWREATEIVEG